MGQMGLKKCLKPGKPVSATIEKGKYDASVPIPTAHFRSTRRNVQTKVLRPSEPDYEKYGFMPEPETRDFPDNGHASVFAARSSSTRLKHSRPKETRLTLCFHRLGHLQIRSPCRSSLEARF
jgi:hypothetical protein